MIDKKTVEYVADLARIEITEEEKENLKEQLGKILDYINKLKELDVENIPPTRGVFFKENVFREDIPKRSQFSQDILRNAPELKENQFKTPKVIE